MNVNEQADRFADLLNRTEDLHPDLATYLEEVNGIGPCLRHPLVYSVPYTTGMNAILNQQYAVKKKLAEEAKAKYNVGRFVALHERSYRLQAFIEICHVDGLPTDYWETLSWIWTDSENIHQNYEAWKRLLTTPRPGREKMMREEEQRFLDALPDVIRIYRGHQCKNRLGMSWTLAYHKACWFSQRLNPKRSGVVTGLVNKWHIIAYLNGRGEQEIVVDPENVHMIKPVQKVRDMNRQWVQDLRDVCIEKFKLSERSDHGPKHWEKVMRNARMPWYKVDGVDADVCIAFALLHDCCREHETNDPEHGDRAAEFARSIQASHLRHFTQQQMAVLTYAIEQHDKGRTLEDMAIRTTNDLTIAICWDADRLDLIRVGIIPNPEMLSTDAAKGYRCII